MEDIQNEQTPQPQQMNRRDFIGEITAGAAGAVVAGSLAAACSSPQSAPPSSSTAPLPRAATPATTIAKRKLGRMDWEASILGLGGAFLYGGEAMVHHALDQGINFIDTAPSAVYNGSQQILGPVMRTRRKEVFLATKVDDRTQAGAATQFRETLRTLQTDHVDLLQLHQIGDQDSLKRAFAPDGALAALVEAKKAGLTRYIGLSSHSTVVLQEALRRFDFDAVLVPISVLNHVIEDYMKVVLPIARQRNMAIIAMKALANGMLTDVDAALRWTMSQPVHCTIAGMSSIEHINTNVTIAKSFLPLSQADQDRLVERFRPQAKPETMYWQRSNVRVG